MMSGDLDVAAKILDRAMQNPRHRTLAMYDLGILRLKEGKVDEGEVLLRETIAQDNADKETPARLVVARYDQQQLIFEERDNPSMAGACTETLAAIDEMRSSPR